MSTDPAHPTGQPTPDDATPDPDALSEEDMEGVSGGTNPFQVLQKAAKQAEDTGSGMYKKFNDAAQSVIDNI
jgi:hypothetical protein